MEEKNNILNDFIDLTVYPEYFFECIDEEPNIIKPYVISYIMLVITVFIYGFNVFMGKSKLFLTLVLVFIGLLMCIAPVLLSTVYLIGSKIMGGEGSFFKILSVLMYSMIPLYINSFISTIGQKVTGNENFSLSPAIFFSDGKFNLFHELLKLLNPFVIWFFILTVIGLSVINGIKKRYIFIMVVISTAILYIIFLFITFMAIYSAIYR